MPDSQKRTKVICQLVGREGTFNGTILNANHSHILVDTGTCVLHANSVYQVKFTVPGADDPMDSEAVVVKTRDEWGKGGKTQQPGVHIASLAFKKLTPENHRALAELTVFFLEGGR